VIVVLAIGLVLAGEARAGEGTAPFWKAHSCTHAHPLVVAKRAVSRILRSPVHYGLVRHVRVRHYKRCVATADEYREMVGYVRAELIWRGAHRFDLAFSRFSPWVHAKLRSIAWCESRANPFTNTGNGFYGKYQFVLGTWRAMGGRGLPSDAVEGEQDFRAARLLTEHGSRHWPVCGR
jgi:hypothetical protein